MRFQGANQDDPGDCWVLVHAVWRDQLLATLHNHVYVLHVKLDAVADALSQFARKISTREFDKFTLPHCAVRLAGIGW